MKIDSYLDRFEAVKAILSTHFQKFHLNEASLEQFADVIEDTASVIPFVDTLAKQNHPPAEDQEHLKKIASQLLKASAILENIGLAGEHALKECGSSVIDCKNEILHMREKIQAAAKMSGKTKGAPTALALELPTVKKSKGKPTNQVQNEMALILARIFRETTGRLPTITVDATTTPPTRKGKYLALVREVFDVYGFTSANATSAGIRAVKQIKTE
jgi:hypothetical protein